MRSESAVLRLLVLMSERTVWQCEVDDGEPGEECTCDACEGYRLTQLLKSDLQ